MMSRRSVLTMVFGLLLPVALACSQQSPAEPARTSSVASVPSAVAGVQPTATPVPSLRTLVEPPPRIDTSIASVPIEDVVAVFRKAL